MTGKKIRILLIDDHTVFRQALAHVINAQPDLELRYHCGSVREGLALLASRSVHVVLLDVDLGSERAIDFLTRARRNGFNGPVLILTAGISKDEEESLQNHGISGVLRKDISIDLLVSCIRQVVSGQPAYDFPIASADRHGETARALTEREAAVLRLIIEGHGNKQIANELGCSEPAVKGIVQQLFHKSGARTRTQLVRVVLEHFHDQI